MKINGVELENFVPAFLREDRNFQGLMYALQEELKAVHEQNDLIKLYVNLENLTDEILDELAWQFNIPEYDKQYSLDIKRSIIKDCLSIHHRRGTVSAVQEVAEKIFGNAEVTEWFEYGGEPFHFRVTTTNISSDDEMIRRFRKAVTDTQNIRSFLEEVTVEAMNNLQVYMGCKAIIIDDIEMETVDLYA